MSIQRPQETVHGFNMRIAEQIYDLVEHGKMTEAANLISARQLDAMKEGMRRANNLEPTRGFADSFDSDAEIHAFLNGWGEHGNAILTAAKQLTEKDL